LPGPRPKYLAMVVSKCGLRILEEIKVFEMKTLIEDFPAEVYKPKWYDDVDETSKCREGPLS